MPHVFLPALRLTLPFTLAHPAAVLPLRRFFVFSALIIGSMAPDFHYFFNLGPRGHFSHSIKGAFVFALPASLLALWIFETVMKVPLISLAPEYHQQRLAGLAGAFRWRPASRFALILLSLMIGIGTHLVWDSLTHEHGLVVRNFPDLSAPALDEFGRERPLYDVLQNTSTVMGMVVLLLWYALWVRRAPAQPVPDYLRMNPKIRIAIIWTILLVSALASLLYGYSYTGHSRRFGRLAGVSSITFMSLVFSGALAYSLWWQWRFGSSVHRIIGRSDHRAIG
jgi:hypothetical protein